MYNFVQKETPVWKLLVGSGLNQVSVGPSTDEGL